MQLNPGLQRTNPRTLSAAILAVMAAAALLLGAAGGYWARGLAPAPAAQPAATQSYAQLTSSTGQNEKLRQRLIDANNFDGSVPSTISAAGNQQFHQKLVDANR